MTAPLIGIELIFGRWLRETRQQLGWTQPDLAERMGVAQPTVSGWETGRRGFTSDAWNQALRAFGVEQTFALQAMAGIAQRMLEGFDRMATTKPDDPEPPQPSESARLDDDSPAVITRSSSDPSRRR